VLAGIAPDGSFGRRRGEPGEPATQNEGGETITPSSPIPLESPFERVACSPPDRK
jgi:hypothetical protein